MSESTWSPSPAAEQLQAIQKGVAGYVLMPLDDEVLDTANQGIRRAIDRMNTRTWNWALTYQDITFVAGTREYALDALFKQPRNFALRNSSATDIDRLMYLPWGSFLKECQWEANGTPNYYSANNPNLFGTIHMDVAPSAAFITTYPTGRLWYYQRIPYPTVTGTTVVGPAEIVGFIQASAEGYAADRYAPQKAAPAYARAEKMYHECVVDDCHGQQTDWE